MLLQVERAVLHLHLLAVAPPIRLCSKTATEGLKSSRFCQKTARGPVERIRISDRQCYTLEIGYDTDNYLHQIFNTNYRYFILVIYYGWIFISSPLFDVGAAVWQRKSG